MKNLQQDEKETIEAITDLQIDMLYDSLAEHFELDSGDVSPTHVSNVDELKEKLAELMNEYVRDNK